METKFSFQYFECHKCTSFVLACGEILYVSFLFGWTNFNMALSISQHFDLICGFSEQHEKKPTEVQSNMTHLWCAYGKSIVGVNDERRPLRQMWHFKKICHVRHLPLSLFLFLSLSLSQSSSPWCSAPSGLPPVKPPVGEYHPFPYMSWVERGCNF